MNYLQKWLFLNLHDPLKKNPLPVCQTALNFLLYTLRFTAENIMNCTLVIKKDDNDCVLQSHKNIITASCIYGYYVFNIINKINDKVFCT